LPIDNLWHSTNFIFVNDDDKKEFLVRFGKNLRELRLQKGFTQEQLANELGVEISQISRIERGIINTSITSLYSLTKILNAEIKDFFV